MEPLQRTLIISECTQQKGSNSKWLRGRRTRRNRNYKKTNNRKPSKHLFAEQKQKKSTSGSRKSAPFVTPFRDKRTIRPGLEECTGTASAAAVAVPPPPVADQNGLILVLRAIHVPRSELFGGHVLVSHLYKVRY